MRDVIVIPHESSKEFEMHRIQNVRNLIKENKLDVARAILLELISGEQASAEVHNLLGNIYTATFAFRDAQQSYETALSINPEYPEAINNIGNVYNHYGWVDDAIKCYQRALELNPVLDKVHSNMLLSMNYSSSTSRDELFDASRAWYSQQCRNIIPAVYETVPIIDKKLAVGYVSPDFRHHPVGFLFQKIVQNYDSDSFRVICYSTNSFADPITNELKRFVQWRDVFTLDDDALVAAIIDDRIDILVDLSGHTAENRLKVFAHRPAPVQVSWLGYYNTTGIPQIDYHITDMATVPPEEDRWFTEKVLRLSGSRFCYTPPDYAPEVSEPPCLRTGLITFGSFNNLAKLNKEVVLTWARLLIAVPNSRLILKWHSLQDERIRDEYIMLFSAAGVHKDQLELRAGSSHAEMLQEYGDIDIALDPFPFSGGLTSLEALWMGVPVITLPLGSPASRQTVSFLLLLGLAGYVASNTDDYIAIAAAHAADVDRLAMTRSVLRLRVKRTLCDGISFMKQIDGIYHHIWEEYCVKHNNCRL